MTAHTSRNYLYSTVVFTLIAFGLFGCRGEHFDRAAWIEQGESALSPFKVKLMGALVEGLEDGPEAAIEVCQLVAPEIANETSPVGIELGRTSHKLRNEHNAPRAWIKPLLDGYVATPTKTEPEVVQLEDGGVGYVEPIFVKRMCLACHGSAVSSAIASRIDELYPRDQARDFEEGDFRGLFWVAFSAAAVESN